ncbi:hypothetical protein H4219_005353 [Mycoemilia scoparia]|uniref:ABC1 atypical kinase-like domain-containing protein n=1 Tax=Mycoemilia scoparia TaxID=417184 RepID=A0A9W7ZPI5_9FUNG|nr:hypothetical protein H4219_005353 [Mycoemilia scoparia]
MFRANHTLHYLSLRWSQFRPSDLKSHLGQQYSTLQHFKSLRFGRSPCFCKSQKKPYPYNNNPYSKGGVEAHLNIANASLSANSKLLYSTINPIPQWKSKFKRQGFRISPLLASLVVGGIVTGNLIYYNYETVQFGFKASQRCVLAGKIAFLVGLDYYRNFPSLPKADDPNTSDEERQEILKQRSIVHKRSAERVLEGMKRNGGVYIKLGQHLSAMSYILPPEWTETMEPLQDQCTPSSIASIDELFQKDLGQSIHEMFECFDPNPLGVASLAQVHKAILKDSHKHVAVKVQHPTVREFAQIDIATVTVLFQVIHKAFPEFKFMWLSDEMNQSLPVELNFKVERQNADEVCWNFAHVENSCLHIPEVYEASERVLVMEYIDGKRIDDLDYLREHHISPWDVSQQLGKIFAEMIYSHGFVHCDPHPGNIMIRAANPQTSDHGYKFDIILLDHGLYRRLTPAFRSQYAQLWQALMCGDEDRIRKISKELAGTDLYRLLASILTGQHWKDIANSSLSSKTAMAEFDLDDVMERTPRFIYKISDILASMPRELILLLKTNDLLRLVDAQLFRDAPIEVQNRAQLKMWANLSHYCLIAIFNDSIARARTASMDPTLYKKKRTKLTKILRVTMSYIRFWAADWPLSIYVWWLSAQDWWYYIKLGLGVGRQKKPSMH